MNEPVFGIYIRGVKHNAVASPSIMKAVSSVKAATPHNQVLDLSLIHI